MNRMMKANPRPKGRIWYERLIRYSPFIIGGIIFVLIPALLPAYLQSIMTKVVIFALFAMSLNIIMGYAGLISLGHAAFFGVSGYTIAILVTRYDIEIFWVIAPLGILMATLVAAILGVIALRVSGLYFLLVTFALSMLIYSIAFKWQSVTSAQKVCLVYCALTLVYPGSPGILPVSTILLL